MPRAVTALFSSRASAEATRDRLVAAGIPAHEIDVQDQGTYASGQTTSEHKGFVDSLKGMFGAHEDHQAYAEGITRGQVLLTATVADSETDKAIQVLEGSDAVDLDRQETEWRSSGWTGQATAGATDDVIQVAEERLVVGKREVERGGVRVRSYIVSTPVSEQVTLREETVGIERRPVNPPSAIVRSKCLRPAKKLWSASKRSSPRRSACERTSASALRKCAIRCVAPRSTSSASKASPRPR